MPPPWRRPPFSVAASCLAVVLRRRFPYLLVGWCWYLGTLFPVIGLVQVGGQAMADRYAYVPLMGIYIAFAWGLSDLVMWLRVSRPVAALATAAMLGTCAVLTFTQVGYWHDTPTLWKRALDLTEENAVANYNYGLYLAHQNQPSKAEPFLEEAVRLAPNWEAAQNNLGIVLNEHRKTRRGDSASSRGGAAQSPGRRRSQQPGDFALQGGEGRTGDRRVQACAQD